MAAAGLSLLVMLMPCMADEPSRPVCEEITSCQECFRSGCFGWQLGREKWFFSPHVFVVRNAGGSVGREV